MGPKKAKVLKPEVVVSTRPKRTLKKPNYVDEDTPPVKKTYVKTKKIDEEQPQSEAATNGAPSNNVTKRKKLYNTKTATTTATTTVTTTTRQPESNAKENEVASSSTSKTTESVLPEAQPTKKPTAPRAKGRGKKTQEVESTSSAKLPEGVLPEAERTKKPTANSKGRVKKIHEAESSTAKSTEGVVPKAEATKPSRAVKGREKKTPAQSNSNAKSAEGVVPEAEPTTKPKAKGGRPKKTKEVQVESSSSAISTEAALPEAEPTAKPKASNKGRAKKIQEAESSSTANTTKDVLPKAGPSAKSKANVTVRAKKIQEVVSSSSADSTQVGVPVDVVPVDVREAVPAIKPENEKAPTVLSDSDDDGEPPAKKSRAAPKAQVVDKESKLKIKVPNKTKTDFSALRLSSTSTTTDGKPWNFKITTWNVDGIRAWVNKGGHGFIQHENPNIICLQEIRCSQGKLPEELSLITDAGYHPCFLSGEKEGYAGVSIYTKELAISVHYGIGNEDFDNEGRIITAEYEMFYLVCVYVPNAGRKLVTLDKRLQWNKIMENYVSDLDKKKPVIICGDLNVAHSEIDLANPKTNKRNAGFTQEERDGMSDLCNLGFVDTFRHLYPDQTQAYTFWTYMKNARSKNVGWRLDYFLISERLLPGLCDNVIRSEVFGSDHCPVTLFMHLNGAPKRQMKSNYGSVSEEDVESPSP